jgi:long-chain fatty acid transport protein
MISRAAAKMGGDVSKSGAIGRTSLWSGVAAGALVVAATGAMAGGFAVREQSTFGQGASFAGVAAGGSQSSMFWNPATMTQFSGRTSETGAAVIFPHASQGGTSTPGALGLAGGLNNTGDDALVPSSYTVWQFNDRFWAGISSNSPFGLGVNFSNPNWAGGAYAQSTTLKTYNATPSFAFKVTDWLSIGGGVQIQYADANLMSFNTPGAPTNLLLINGTGWGWGWTAGLTVTPTPTTQIGLGYRSAIDQDIEGALTLAPTGAGTPGSVSTTLKLPDIVSLGIRQRIGAQFTLLGTVEWSNWSRIGTSLIQQPNGATARATSGALITLPFQYDDGWFYSVGLEYLVSPAWTLRAGFGYEVSPITDQVRTPRVPDNDRYWFSVGATNTVNSRFSIDLAYTYIDVVDTPVTITAASGNPWFNGVASYVGSANSNVHILSLAAKFRWDEPANPLITK